MSAVPNARNAERILRPNHHALTSQVVADPVGDSSLVPVWSALYTIYSALIVSGVHYYR